VYEQVVDALFGGKKGDTPTKTPEEDNSGGVMKNIAKVIAQGVTATAAVNNVMNFLKK
jgi:hypothetical protein